MRIRRRPIALLATLLFVSGCGDSTPPAPPYLDPVSSPTAETSLLVTGSAEFGAKLLVTGAAAVEPAAVVADPYTGRFHLVATLNPNTASDLSFIAVDAAGNASLPTVVHVVHEARHGQAAAVGLELYVNGGGTPAADPVVLRAGDTVRAVTRVTDAGGHTLDVPVSLTTNAPGAFVAGAEVSGLTSTGAFKLAASAIGTAAATTRTFTVKSGPAARIDLAVATELHAGEPAEVRALAVDAYGNPVPSAEIALAVSPSLSSSFTPPCGTASLEQGFLAGQQLVVYDLSGTPAGNHVYTVTATSGDVEARAAVTVHPGPAARFAPRNPSNCAAGEVFAFTDSSWSGELATPTTIAAGETLFYRYRVIDAYGNPAAGPVAVFSDAPGAQLVDDGVSGRGQLVNATTAGSYQLSAYISGVSTPAVRSFTVKTAAPYVLALQLSASLAERGDVVKSFAVVRDRFGNVVPCPAASSPVEASVYEATVSSGAVDSALGGPTSCVEGVFSRDFTFSRDDSYSITGTYKVGATVSARAYVTILGLDSTPPTARIENLRVNGALCVPTGSPPVCSVSINDEVSFNLVADDNVSLSSVEYSAYFATANNGTGTLRSRRVLVAADTPRPYVIPMKFTVPNSAAAELVPLVGLVVDGAGNITSSDTVLLGVGLVSANGRAWSLVASSAQGVNAPSDVAFDRAGNLFIANEGASQLLQLAPGVASPTVVSSFRRAASYLTTDAVGNVYASAGNEVWRVNAAGAVSYLSFGGTARGLTALPATSARGVIDVSVASDGATVTVGTRTFEYDLAGNGCLNGGATCVAATFSARAAALATAIDGVSTEVRAAAVGSLVVVEARVAGEAGNTITFTATGTLALQPTSSPGNTLREGHGEELFVGQLADNNVYRFPETLTSLPGNTAAAHGSYSVARRQRGLAVKDMGSLSNGSYRDLYFYVIDDGASGTVRAYRAVNGNAPVPVWSISGSNTTNFGSLYDLALEPTRPAPAQNPANGCLLLSDTSGRIWAIDTRDPASTTPSVTLVASGFQNPRGIAFSASGDLYVTDAGLDAVFSVSPSASGTDCF